MPSPQPSRIPTRKPSLLPSRTPSSSPVQAPSIEPTKVPSLQPSKLPSLMPSKLPSLMPSQQLSRMPTLKPSPKPTTAPSPAPSPAPSRAPSFVPTRHPVTKTPSSLALYAPTAGMPSIHTKRPSRLVSTNTPSANLMSTPLIGSGSGSTLSPVQLTTSALPTWLITPSSTTAVQTPSMALIQSPNLSPTPAPYDWWSPTPQPTSTGWDFYPTVGSLPWTSTSTLGNSPSVMFSTSLFTPPPTQGPTSGLITASGAIAAATSSLSYMPYVYIAAAAVGVLVIYKGCKIYDNYLIGAVEKKASNLAQRIAKAIEKEIRLPSMNSSRKKELFGAIDHLIDHLTAYGLIPSEANEPAFMKDLIQAIIKTLGCERHSRWSSISSISLFSHSLLHPTEMQERIAEIIANMVTARMLRSITEAIQNKIDIPSLNPKARRAYFNAIFELALTLKASEIDFETLDENEVNTLLDYIVNPIIYAVSFKEQAPSSTTDNPLKKTSVLNSGVMDEHEPLAAVPVLDVAYDCYSEEKEVNEENDIDHEDDKIEKNINAAIAVMTALKSCRIKLGSAMVFNTNASVESVEDYLVHNLMKALSFKRHVPTLIELPNSLVIEVQSELEADGLEHDGIIGDAQPIEQQEQLLDVKESMENQMVSVSIHRQEIIELPALRHQIEFLSTSDVPPLMHQEEDDEGVQLTVYPIIDPISDPNIVKTVCFTPEKSTNSSPVISHKLQLNIEPCFPRSSIKSQASSSSSANSAIKPKILDVDGLEIEYLEERIDAYSSSDSDSDLVSDCPRKQDVILLVEPSDSDVDLEPATSAAIFSPKKSVSSSPLFFSKRQSSSESSPFLSEHSTPTNTPESNVSIVSESSSATREKFFDVKSEPVVNVRPHGNFYLPRSKLLRPAPHGTTSENSNIPHSPSSGWV